MKEGVKLLQPITCAEMGLWF